MTRRQLGFTFGELMIVVALLAILVAIATPSFVSARVSANETNAIATLRSIIAAQMQFRECVAVDTDQDGRGEYGGFLEMSGQRVGRCVGGKRARPALSSAFRLLSPDGEARRCGYLFRIFLPRSDRTGLPEPDSAYHAAIVDSNLAEESWCCYAWPVDPGQGGGHTFMANQRGEVLRCLDLRYAGTGNGPAHDAAFRGPSITTEAARGVQGRDGSFWMLVN